MHLRQSASELRVNSGTLYLRGVGRCARIAFAMKLHRYLTALCLAAPMCLAESADVDADYEEDYGDDYEEVADRTYTKEEVAAAVKKFAELLTRMNTVLQGVKDLATADAAAPIYVELEKKLHDDEIYTPLRNADPSDVMKLVRESRNVQKALYDVYFYGSAALAKAVGGDASDAVAPLPLTPEVQATLLASDEEEDSERIVFHIGDDEDDRKLSATGGPGFTRETAWVSSANSPNEAEFHAYTIVINKYDAETNLVKMVQKVEDSKVYKVLTVDFGKQGSKYRGDVWVDVSAGCKIYTPEQQQEALAKVTQYMREASQVVLSVQDKASADAAADRLLEMKVTLQNEELMEILSSMESEVVSRAMKEAVSEEEMDAASKRIRENNFYGSEKLKAL